MAHVEKYWMYWDSPSGAEGVVRISEDNYGGSSEQLNMLRGSLEIRKTEPSWENPIIRQNCSFTILNNKDDWYELLPLMTSEESLYKVRVEIWLSGSAIQETLFEGFMDTKVVNQPMLNYAPLQLTASGFLQKLSYVDIPEIETLQVLSLIDIIDACLTATGASYNIKVKSDIYPRSNVPTSTQTLFNKAAIYTELFWTSNVKKMSGLDILKTILKTFRCYLYWFDECWYIEQYDNMHWTNETFVEYTTGVSYTHASTAATSSEGRNAYDIYALAQGGGSQSLDIIPGYKEVEVKLNQKGYNNLFRNDLTDFTSINSGVPDPDIREWQIWEDDSNWLYAGQSWKNISNSALRAGIEVTGPTTDHYKGLYTKFKVAVEADTSLTIRFKCGPQTPATVHADFASDPGRFEFRFYYYIRVEGSGPPYDFLVYNDVAAEWQVQSWTVESSGLNFIDINGASFDTSIWTVEASITIPLGEVAGWPTTDKTLIFASGTELITDTSDSSESSLTYVYYGDFGATISETAQNNVIKGDINSGFLNKLDLSLDLFDMESLNYKNGMLTGVNFDERTISWGDGSDWQPIAKKLIQFAFRLYNISRQKIKLTYHTATVFWPLHMFYDSKQSTKPFILGSETHRPDMDEHDIELLEWDGSTVINLI